MEHFRCHTLMLHELLTKRTPRLTSWELRVNSWIVLLLADEIIHETTRNNTKRTPSSYFVSVRVNSWIVLLPQKNNPRNKRNTTKLASGRMRKNTSCLLSGMVWNGALRKTIEMVVSQCRCR